MMTMTNDDDTKMVETNPSSESEITANERLARDVRGLTNLLNSLYPQVGKAKSRPKSTDQSTQMADILSHIASLFTFQATMATKKRVLCVLGRFPNPQEMTILVAHDFLVVQNARDMSKVKNTLSSLGRNTYFARYKSSGEDLETLSRVRVLRNLEQETSFSEHVQQVIAALEDRRSRPVDDKEADDLLRTFLFRRCLKRIQQRLDVDTYILQSPAKELTNNLPQVLEQWIQKTKGKDLGDEMFKGLTPEKFSWNQPVLKKELESFGLVATLLSDGAQEYQLNASTAVHWVSFVKTLLLRLKERIGYLRDPNRPKEASEIPDEPAALSTRERRRQRQAQKGGDEAVTDPPQLPKHNLNPKFVEKPVGGHVKDCLYGTSCLRFFEGKGVLKALLLIPSLKECLSAAYHSRISLQEEIDSIKMHGSSPSTIIDGSPASSEDTPLPDILHRDPPSQQSELGSEGDKGLSDLSNNDDQEGKESESDDEDEDDSVPAANPEAPEYTNMGDESIEEIFLRYFRGIIAWDVAAMSVSYNPWWRNRTEPLHVDQIFFPPPENCTMTSPAELCGEAFTGMEEFQHDDDKAAKYMTTLHDKGLIKAKFDGTCHCEADVLMSWLLASKKSQEEITSVDARFRRCAPYLGISKKSCWCCYWLRDRAGERGVDVSLGGTHGIVMPWSPPPDTPEDLLEKLRTELFEKLRYALKAQYDAPGIVLTSTRSSPAASQTFEPPSPRLPESGLFDD